MIKKIFVKNELEYNIKFCLKSNSNNIGFFNVFDDESIGIDDEFYLVSGECNSRLFELEKSLNSDIFDDKYIASNNINNNGVNYMISNINYVIYYIDGIEYIDDVINNITSFKLNSNGLNSDNSHNSKIYLDESILNSINIPKVKSDIFIERPTFKIVEPFFRISFIENLNELYDVDGGSYYNIVKNE